MGERYSSRSRARAFVFASIIISVLVQFRAGDLRASGVFAEWVARFSGPTNQGGLAVAVDTGGTENAYVTGYSGNGAGSYDYVTVAYSSSGMALWTNRYGAASYSYAKAIAVDSSSGNVYVTGESDADPLTSDFGTVAYSNSGTPLWTNLYNSPGQCCAVAEAVGTDSSGRVYVGGSVGGMQPDYAIVCYGRSGEPLWTNVYKGVRQNGTDALQAMAVAGEGAVYVTGFSDDADGSAQFATLAYSNKGAALWTNRYGRLGENYGTAIGLDVRVGRVYVTGRSPGSGTAGDYATVAYSSNGVALWTNWYNGPANGDDTPRAIIVDDVGNVYVTGGSEWGAGIYEFATVAYSGAGAPLWTNRYNDSTSSNSSAWALTIDGRGDIVVAGNSGGTTPDYALVAYSRSGLPVWTNRYNGPAGGWDAVAGSFCLSHSANGAIYITGGSQATYGPLTKSEYTTIKYVVAPDIVLKVIERLPNGACRLNAGAPSNTPYRLEASADLTNWQTLTNFPPLPVPSIEYTDSLAPGFVQRFYRAVWSP